ncbi:MAG: CsbD-like [Candidatus Nitrotoga sp. SPKER]|nr:MAG: CsbD-like [Candidatus Nitrotoga sp. SPKER]
MNRDQVKGRINQSIGQIKEMAGKFTEDKKLEAQGNVQKNMGKRQAEFGDLNNDLKKWRLKRT